MLHGLSIIEQRLLWPQLTADGFRPIAISVAPSPDGGLPVAASVWYRPMVAEEAKDRLAQAPGQCGRGAAEAQSRAKGVADSPTSPRSESPELSHSPFWPPRRGSEPGPDSVGQAG